MTDVFTYPTRRSRWSARDLPQLRDEPRDGGFRDTAGEAVALRVSNIDHPPERLLDRGLRRTPGEKICYSNFGFGLLGTVLALRAPTSYEQLVRERICEPLGRSTTPGSRSRPRPLPRF